MAVNWRKGGRRAFLALAVAYILGASLYGWIAWTAYDRAETRFIEGNRERAYQPAFTAEEISYLDKLATVQGLKATPAEARLMRRRFDQTQQSIAGERQSRNWRQARTNLLRAAIFGFLALLLAIGLALAWVIRGFRAAPVQEG